MSVESFQPSILNKVKENHNCMDNINKKKKKNIINKKNKNKRKRKKPPRVIRNLSYPKTYHVNYNYDESKTINSQVKKSFGILCVTLDGYMVLTCNPSYFIQRFQSYHFAHKRVNSNCVSSYDVVKQTLPSLMTPLIPSSSSSSSAFSTIICRQITLNSNEHYNLLLASFPNGTVEGQFCPPRGKIDAIDNNDTSITKVREFLEESKFSHSILPLLSKNHFQNPNYKSILNSAEHCVTEEWIGLDNNRYRVEYCVLIIKSLKELEYIGKRNNVPSKCIIDKLLPTNIYNKSTINHYRRRFKYNANLDKLKQTIALPITLALAHLNTHKLKIIKSIESKKLFSLIKKYE